MKHFHAMLLVVLGFFLSISLVVGCTAKLEEETSVPEDVTPTQESPQIENEVKQDQNIEFSDNCDAIKSELEATQAKYEELQSKYSELNTTYNKLKADYDELSAKYDTLTKGTAEVSEKDVEQAIFELINQDRQNNGLNELKWGVTFYEWAKRHSNDMATKNRLEYSDLPYWQDVFQAAGYNTLDEIANAALMVWKASTTYGNSFLNGQAIYGVVAVSKSGEIFYITFFSSVER